MAMHRSQQTSFPSQTPSSASSMAWYCVTAWGSLGSTHGTLTRHQPRDLLGSTHKTSLLAHLCSWCHLFVSHIQQLQLVWGWSILPFLHQRFGICSGAEMAPVPSSLGNKQGNFNGAATENKAKGILAPLCGGVSSSSFIKSLSFLLVHSLNFKCCFLSCCWKPAVYHLYC